MSFRTWLITRLVGKSVNATVTAALAGSRGLSVRIASELADEAFKSLHHPTRVAMSRETLTALLACAIDTHTDLCACAASSLDRGRGTDHETPAA
jgi:hypothetical protein